MSCRVFSSREEVVGVISSLFAFEEFYKNPPKLDPKQAHLLHYWFEYFQFMLQNFILSIEVSEGNV